MIYVTHIPKREHKRALRDIYAVELVTPKFNPRSACLITFDSSDHPTNIHHGSSAAVVLDPIIDGYHLTRVLMDGSNTTFKGVIPSMEARCTGSLKLEVVFGSLDNFQSKELIFDIVPFHKGYDALLG